jgi:hypothetical protein
LPESLQPFAAELATYLRELPRLLDEGEEGRWVMIQGNTVLSTWDTFRDARQAGYERFGLDRPFMTQKVDRRDLERFAPFFPAAGEPETGNGSCPSSTVS